MSKRFRWCPAIKQTRGSLFHIGDEYELSIRHFGHEVPLDHENISIVPEDQQVYGKRDLDMSNALDQELLSKTAFMVSTGHIAITESRRRPDMEDMVCLIPSCSFPMILRPHEELDDISTVVGACYIQDFMTEEGQAEFLAEKELEEFCLV